MYMAGFTRSLILTLANLYDLCGCVREGLLISSFHPSTPVVLIRHIYMFHQMKLFVLPEVHASASTTFRYRCAKISL